MRLEVSWRILPIIPLLFKPTTGQFAKLPVMSFSSLLAPAYEWFGPHSWASSPMNAIARMVDAFRSMLG